MLQQIKDWVMEQVLWAEKNLKGKPGGEKRAAVVQKVDDMVKLPWWLEWVDGPVIGWLVDQACDLLNEARGHDWGDVPEEEQAEMAKGLTTEAAPGSVPVSEEAE